MSKPTIRTQTLHRYRFVYSHRLRKHEYHRHESFLARNFPYSENLDSLDQPALGYSVRIGESPADCIKADFFYTENFIFPVKQTDGIRLADIREIAAMKIKAITQEEPRQKDFWDIYELNNTYSLKEMIEWAMMRDEWSFTKTI